MADKMPPELLERFKKKNEAKEDGANSKKKRMEALEKARKHKEAKDKE